MKFEEALTAMREGKKVRSNGGDYIYISDGEIVDKDCAPKNFSCTEILTDWEIYEEPKWEPEELWKEIPNCINKYGETYAVSSFGNVQNSKTGKTLKQHDNRRGYLKVSLPIGYVAVHRLVAKMFVPGNTSLTVNHIDEDKHNNHYMNLEWLTNKENINHGSGIERSSKARATPVYGFNKSRGEILLFEHAKDPDIKRMGLSGAHINECCNGKRKSHKGFKWRKISRWRLTRLQKQISTFNRFLAYVDEHAPDWEPNWEPNWKTDPNWYVYFNHNENTWKIDYATFSEYACTVFMPREVAKKLVDDLNNGRVEL